ncbi:MAG: RluA family pseudouridine synthase [Oscillospiraceae bacterium]
MILYEDAQLVVCCKPRGVLSAADSSGQESMASLLAPRTVFPVHRLDRDVPGVMSFAKTREAAAFLSAHLNKREYLALAWARRQKPEELYDLLFHDRARNKTYVVRRTRAGVREARLICTPLRLLPDGRAALHLQLLTGRTHQIRVQLGSRGCPVCGDRKYGAQAAPGGIALYAWRLRVPHPDGRSLTFRLPEELLPPELQGLAEDL